MNYNMRCKACYGSGRIMGGGFIHKNCDICDGSGKIFVDSSSNVASLILDKAIDKPKRGRPREKGNI